MKTELLVWNTVVQYSSAHPRPSEIKILADELCHIWWIIKYNF